MRTSSATAAQLEFEEFAAEARSGPPPAGVLRAQRAKRESSVTTFTPLSAPSIDAYASASRILARLNTSMVKKEEVEGLLRERQSLLDKKFDGTITPQEENRLEYVRWSLGRIQDAKSGPALDALEGVVAAYERFVSDQDNFVQQLHRAANRDRARHR